MKNSSENTQKPHRLWECLCGQGQCYEWSDGTTDCGWIMKLETPDYTPKVAKEISKSSGKKEE
jgi:hypothetical protein